MRFFSKHLPAMAKCLLSLTLVSCAVVPSAQKDESEVKIKGGTEFGPNDMLPKAMVSLTTCATNPDGTDACWRCTGTILSPTWILTAAHCDARAAGNIAAGGITWVQTYKGKDHDGGSYVVNRVDYPIGTTPGDFRNEAQPDKFLLRDIAMVHLASPIAIDGINRLAAIPFAPLDFSSPPAKAYAAGGGDHGPGHVGPANSNATLRWREISYINPFGVSYEIEATLQQVVINEDVVNGGDSGSGFLTVKDGKIYAMGVLSYHHLADGSTFWNDSKTHYTYTGFYYLWIMGLVNFVP